MLDLALPMLVSAGARMIAMHAPAHYVFDAHSRRAVYLARLQDEQRLVLVAGLERGAVNRRCVWLLIFTQGSGREAQVPDDPRRTHGAHSAALRQARVGYGSSPHGVYWGIRQGGKIRRQQKGLMIWEAGGNEKGR